MIPIFLFGSAHFLRGRGAPFVANALSLLGGAVTPIVLFAAFADGAAFPPDLTDVALVGTLTVVSLALAVTYGFAARAVPESPIRYLAAPMVWVAAGVVGLVVEREPSMAQMAIVAAAIVGVAVAARRLANHHLSRPTLAVTVPGLVVASALVVLFGWGEGWPPIPSLVAGITAIAAAELLPGKIGMPWLVKSLAVVTTGLAVSVTWGFAPVGIGGTAAFIALIEFWRTREHPPGVLPLKIVGSAAGVAMTATEPRALLAGSLLTAAWAHWRHVVPLDEPTRRFVMALAAVTPVTAVLALAQLFGVAVALAAAGTTLLAGSLAVRIGRLDDMFYRVSLPVGASLTIGATFALDATQVLLRSELGVLAVAAGSASLVLAVAVPLRGVRVWSASAGFAWTTLVTLRSWGIDSDAQAATIGVVGALAVIASIAWGDREGGHLAAAGHIGTLGALVFAGTETSQLVALGSWTVAWIAQSVGHEWDRSPLTTLCQSWLENVRRLRALVPVIAPIVTMISTPFLLAALVDGSGVLEGERGRMGLLLAAIAVGYGGLARLATGRRPLAPLLASGGVILSGIAIAIAAPEPWPTIVAVLSTIVVVGVIGGALRKPVMTWFAWTVSSILTLLLGDQLGVPEGSLHLVLLGWGAVLLIGGLGYDDIRAGRRHPGEGIRTSWLVPPTALEAIAIPAALAFRLSDGASDAWPPAVGAGVLYLMVSLQLRAGAASAAGYGLLALGAGLGLDGTRFDPLLAPWVLVVFAAGLLVISWSLERLTSNRDPWIGWDTAPLVAGHGIAVVALVTSAGRRRPGVGCARSPRPGARAVEKELVLAGRLGGPDPGRDHRRPRGVVAVGARDQRAPPGRSPETQDGFALDPLLCARDVRHRSGTRWHRLVAAGSAVDVRAVGGPPLDRLVRARTHALGSRSTDRLGRCAVRGSPRSGHRHLTERYRRRARAGDLPGVRWPFAGGGRLEASLGVGRDRGRCFSHRRCRARQWLVRARPCDCSGRSPGRCAPCGRAAAQDRTGAGRRPSRLGLGRADRLDRLVGDDRPRHHGLAERRHRGRHSVGHQGPATDRRVGAALGRAGCSDDRGGGRWQPAALACRSASLSPVPLRCGAPQPV